MIRRPVLGPLLGPAFRSAFGIARHTRGAAAIEFAFALPLLVGFLIGIVQFGLVLQTSGGIRHAIGQGLRYAAVHPAATEAEVVARAREAMGGIDTQGIRSLRLERGTANGARFDRITIRYEVTPRIPFVTLPAIALSESRTAYRPD